MQTLLTQIAKTKPAVKRFNLKVVLVLASVILLGIIASAVWAISQQSGTSAHPNKAVDTTSAVTTVTSYIVSRVPVTSQVVASGTVAARHTVDIGPELSGLRVTEVNVEEGDSVKKGQILARLNADLLQAQLNREHANLLGAIANVQKTRQPNRSEDIAGLEAAYHQALAGISQAEANLKRAQTNVTNLRTISSRYENLRTQGAISIQDSLDKQTAASMATDDVAVVGQQLQAARYSAKQAEEHLRAARAGGREVDVSISQSNVAQIQASVKQIEAQIQQTIVRAPADGVITKRNADVGEISSQAQAFFSIARHNDLELRVQVQEIDLPGVQQNATVTITPAAPGLSSIKANVREISPIVDSRTRLGTVFIDLDSVSGLKQGMYASSSIETGTRLSLVVPTKAILSVDGEKFVFVLNGNKVERRSIKTANSIGDMVEVQSGLSAGERIVLAGAGFLKDRDVVNVSDGVLRSAVAGDKETSNGLQ